MANKPKLVLGADLSTDALEWHIYDVNTLQEVQAGSLNFVTFFGAKYGLEKGGYIELDNGAVRIPYGMILDAIDEMMRQVAASLGKDLQYLRRMIVSCQQHGMVTFAQHFEDRLAEIGNQPQSILSNLTSLLFSNTHATSWRDTSTEQVCLELERSMGSDGWARLTGSSPMQSLRFLGPQLLRERMDRGDGFNVVETCTVLAGMGGTILTGQKPVIGRDEASCTLMMNLATGQWDDALLNVCFPKVRHVLPPIIAPCSPLGSIWSYWVKRHGFPETCTVSMGMGDNIAAQVTTAHISDKLSISCGSSGTVFQAIPKATFDPAHISHVLRTGEDGFMGMFCTPDCGKLVDQVRTKGGWSWEDFDDLVQPEAPFGAQEIWFPREKKPLTCSMDRAQIPTAVVRSVLGNMKLHSDFLGAPSSIVGTGGLLEPAIAQVACDMWGVPLTVVPKLNRVAVGSVIVAIAQETGRTISEVASCIIPQGTKYLPDPSRQGSYQAFLAQLKTVLA